MFRATGRFEQDAAVEQKTGLAEMIQNYSALCAFDAAMTS